MKTKQEKLFEDLYDIMIESKWKQEAENNIRKYFVNKNAEYNGDTNEISIGKKFKIKLVK